MYVKEQVKKLITKYKTTDPYLLCDLLGITILGADLGDDVNGMYQHFKRISIIHLNHNLTEDEAKVVLAHEVGHHVLHRNYNCTFLASHTYLVKEKYERQANVFASEILLPDKLPEECKDYSIDQLAMYYHVPVEIIKLKRYED